MTTKSTTQLLLVGESFSPWTKKARWALEHCDLSYNYKEYTPTLSEPALRLRLRQFSGQVSVPILFADKQIIRGSFEIARYANDRVGDGRLGDFDAINTEMMSLYRKEKVNPMGGCLPIMVQIPVFISLYWVLIETVELRQAPFVLWVQDLSAKDPFFVLPVVMGITMFLQQRLNPAPVDPLQAKIMRMFPIVFTVFFLFFPAGLVLYWVMNNSLSIIQQWYITNKIVGKTPPANDD